MLILVQRLTGWRARLIPGSLATMDFELCLNQIVRAAAEELGVPEVVIVYEDFSTGLRAKQLFDRLFQRMESAKYRLNMWKFSVLHLHALRSQAIHDAASAAILCVSAQGQGELPPPVYDWANQWSHSSGPHPYALVALLEKVLEADGSDTAYIRRLRKMAQQKEADFFFTRIDRVGQEERLSSPPREIRV